MRPRTERAVVKVFTLAGLTLAAAGFMVWTAHPVYMVVSLVLVASGIGALTVAGGAPFVGLVVVLVYVGAVNVLFLFVIMMINFRSGGVAYRVEHAWYGIALVGGVAGWSTPGGGWTTPTVPPGGAPRLTGLGDYLFATGNVVPGVMIGGALFVAMTAAICLTMVSGENYRTQSFFVQTARSGALWGVTRG